jgi:hypothetical protein
MEFLYTDDRRGFDTLVWARGGGGRRIWRTGLVESGAGVVSPSRDETELLDPKGLGQRSEDVSVLEGDGCPSKLRLTC